MRPAVPDEVIYRCIDPACARALPRPVKFCPYCGSAQQPGAVNPALANRDAARPVIAPAARPAAPAPARATAAQAGAPEAAPAQAPAPPPAAAPRAAAAASPPLREPVRLRYWLLALAALWLVWFYAKPSTKKIDARIDHAIALSAECRFSEAQSELIALRSASATPAQLDRLQSAINQAVPACDKKRQRAERQRCFAAGRSWISGRCM